MKTQNIGRLPAFVMALVMALLVSACAVESEETTAALKPEQRAWRLIDDGALLIDVRSRQEYEAGHLADAVNIPHNEVDKLSKYIGEDKDKEVVVYCRSGRRAEEAKEALHKKGYKNVHNGLGYEELVAVQKQEES